MPYVLFPPRLGDVAANTGVGPLKIKIPIAKETMGKTIVKLLWNFLYIVNFFIRLCETMLGNRPPKHGAYYIKLSVFFGRNRRG